MEEEQFTQRVTAARDKLFRIAYTILHDEQDCADAMQEALLRAWQKRGTLRDMAAFRSWLCRIVANTCTELLRRKQRTTLTDIPEEMPAPQSDGRCESAFSHWSISRITNSAVMQKSIPVRSHGITWPASAPSSVPACQYR